MKLFLKIITNPFGIAINVVHWTIVIFAFYAEGNPFEKETALCFHCSRLITDWLFVIDIIPLLLIELVATPLMIFFGKNHLIDVHLQFLLIFITIFHWSLIGFVINFLIDFHRPKEIKISFK